MPYKGQIVRVTAVRDLTQRRQAEEALRASEEHLRLALEASQMGTWEWIVETNEVKWSSQVEKIFGLNAGEFDGSYESYLEAGPSGRSGPGDSKRLPALCPARSNPTSPSIALCFRAVAFAGLGAGVRSTGTLPEPRC